MSPSLSHEKLDVYGKALDFAASCASWLKGWKRKHAFCDHLARASESVLENLAEACAAYSGAKFIDP